MFNVMSNIPRLGTVIPILPAGSDVEKAIAFYEQQLGFTTIYKEGDPITMAIIERDAAELFLYQNDDTHLAKGTALRIQVDRIEQLHEEFQAKGGRMIHPKGTLQLKPWGAKEFVVLDPAGVCITFYEFPN